MDSHHESFMSLDSSVLVLILRSEVMGVEQSLFIKIVYYQLKAIPRQQIDVTSI